MSLINDALRRATTQESKRDPNELPTMQPTYRPIRAGGAGFSIFVICFILAAAVTLGVWIYWKRGITPATAKPAPIANTNNNPIARASQTLGKVDALNKEGENAADNMQRPSATPVAKPVANANAAATPSAGPKLQGIFYSANNASVIINGKSMKVGDESGGVKVIAINKESVRVESAGQVRELTMK